jgi:hypothetical protein
VTDAGGFDVGFNAPGSHDFLSLPRPIRRRVRRRITILRRDPRAVGEYRVIYEIDDRAHRVIIIRVRHRSEAYDRP